MRYNKAQSALEFLTTYGWAFLVILVMIGALAYFGVLNPTSILPNRCTFGPEFQCMDYQISATTNQFKIKLKNNQGEPINVTTLSLTSDSSTSYTCIDAPGQDNGGDDGLPSINGTIQTTGNVTDYIFSGCNTAGAGFYTGKKGKVQIKVKYYSLASGVSYTKESGGEVFATVT